MEQSEIKVGRTYINKGAGRTKRKVVAIGYEHKPVFYSSYLPTPNNPGVLYEQDGKLDNLYLRSFAAWCGKMIES